jgi:hypothetical protein
MCQRDIEKRDVLLIEHHLVKNNKSILASTLGTTNKETQAVKVGNSRSSPREEDQCPS